MSGKHARRRTDGYRPPPFGQANQPEEIKAFQDSLGHGVINAADKRLHGEYPYDWDGGSKPPIERQP